MFFDEDMDQDHQPNNAARWKGTHDGDTYEVKGFRWVTDREYKVRLDVVTGLPGIVTLEYLSIGQDFRTVKGLTVGLFENDNVPLPV